MPLMGLCGVARPRLDKAVGKKRLSACAQAQTVGKARSSIPLCVKQKLSNGT